MPKYSAEKNVQILISLMKQHGIRKVIVSPGMKNIPFVASVQFDNYFELYSCVDERSAAYMACGLAVESGEPVALSCTGATASRNYMSAFTEAFYRNIPILAVTSMSHQGEIGHLIPQIIDRNVSINDTAKMSVQINQIHSEKDEWDVNVKLNKALLELKHKNGGPVHVNLICDNYTDFTDKLIKTRKISRISDDDVMPEIKADRVAIYVGSHRLFQDKVINSIELFCEKYNGVVLCDNTSNYHGKYCVYPSVISAQVLGRSKLLNIDLLIHIGDVSGAYIGLKPKKVWRVNPDGEIRDTYKTLSDVFEMTESKFFSYYSGLEKKKCDLNYYKEWVGEQNQMRSALGKLNLPFSNAWIASMIEHNLPKNAVLFLGILNSLRNWNFFEIRNNNPCYANTGGFGIDGILSTAIGAALANKNKIYYVVLGDLALFYDLNSMGNRHVPSNLRILLINNGMGIEFRNYRHPSAQFGNEASLYMAAAGHFGNKSVQLIKHYSEDLGYTYLCASNRDEFVKIKDYVLSDEQYDKPLIIELFTEMEDESNALKMICNIYKEKTAKQIAKNILGDEGVRTVSKIIRRS